eukprot:943439-Amphidinium_carterae.1
MEHKSQPVTFCPKVCKRAPHTIADRTKQDKTLPRYPSHSLCLSGSFAVECPADQLDADQLVEERTILSIVW